MTRSTTDLHFDVPKVLAPPPFIFLGALAVGLLLQALFPKSFLRDEPSLRVVGGLLIVAGLSLSAMVVRYFRHADTPVSPRRPSRQLVVSGPYRLSRNPDYAGQTLVLAGLGLLFNALWVLLAIVPALLLVRYGVIAQE